MTKYFVCYKVVEIDSLVGCTFGVCPTSNFIFVRPHGGFWVTERDANSQNSLCRKRLSY